MTISTNKLWPKAIEPLTQIVKEFNYPIRLLEIGTWFGEGSLTLWLNEIKNDSSITVVDGWKPYFSEIDRNLKPSVIEEDEATEAAFYSTYNIIKNFEKNNSSRNIDVTMIRGDSRNVLPQLKDNYYDFIYIDGDHTYDPVKKEIQNAKRLINKKFGIICGDDYKYRATEEYLEIARNNLTRDHVSPGFHPGVMLAVHEEFQSVVNKSASTWWIYCIDGNFTTVYPGTGITCGGFYPE